MSTEAIYTVAQNRRTGKFFACILDDPADNGDWASHEEYDTPNEAAAEHGPVAAEALRNYAKTQAAE